MHLSLKNYEGTWGKNYEEFYDWTYHEFMNFKICLHNLLFSMYNWYTCCIEIGYGLIINAGGRRRIPSQVLLSHNSNLSNIPLFGFSVYLLLAPDLKAVWKASDISK